MREMQKNDFLLLSSRNAKLVIELQNSSQRHFQVIRLCRAQSVSTLSPATPGRDENNKRVATVVRKKA